VPAPVQQPRKQMPMNNDKFREYSAKLDLLYAGFFASLRSAFTSRAPRAVRARGARAEQRWESEGGKAK
jgi:hypothetical protein